MHFRSTIDTSRSRTRGIQFIIFNFIEKVFCFNTYKKRCNEASRFKVGSSNFVWSFLNLEVPKIISSIALLLSIRPKMTTHFLYQVLLKRHLYFCSGFVKRDVDVIHVEKICSCENNALLSDFWFPPKKPKQP